jgi:acetyl esterase/lipase
MDWRLSPLYGDVSGLHDVRVYVGTREIFYPDVIAFAHKVKEAGVSCEVVVGHGLNHVWPVYPTPEAARAQTEIAALVTG